MIHQKQEAVRDGRSAQALAETESCIKDLGYKFRMGRIWVSGEKGDDISGRGNNNKNGNKPTGTIQLASAEGT